MKTSARAVTCFKHAESWVDVQNWRACGMDDDQAVMFHLAHEELEREHGA